MGNRVYGDPIVLREASRRSNRAAQDLEDLSKEFSAKFAAGSDLGSSAWGRFLDGANQWNASRDRALPVARHVGWDLDNRAKMLESVDTGKSALYGTLGCEAQWIPGTSEPSGVLKAVGRHTSPENFVDLINPDGPRKRPSYLWQDWGEKGAGYGRSNNCAACAQAFQSTWNGQPAQAPAIYKEYNGAPTFSQVADLYELPDSFEAATTSPSDIEDRLLKAGPGSSAIITIDWNTGGSHAANAVNDGGVIKYVDSQRAQVTKWPPPSDVVNDGTLWQGIFFDSHGRPVP